MRSGEQHRLDHCVTVVAVGHGHFEPGVAREPGAPQCRFQPSQAAAYRGAGANKTESPVAQRGEVGRHRIECRVFVDHHRGHCRARRSLPKQHHGNPGFGDHFLHFGAARCGKPDQAIDTPIDEAIEAFAFHRRVRMSIANQHSVPVRMERHLHPPDRLGHQGLGEVRHEETYRSCAL